MSLYRFGVFELDESSGELTRAGRRQHLAPQPFRALALLLERAGQVVTREELRQALWNGTTFVDFDRNLAFTIRCIRAALGDDARSPAYLETLPRRGFRFVAPVQRIEEAPRAVPVTAVAPPLALPPPQADRRAPGLVARAVLAGLMALAAGYSRPRLEPSAPARAAFQLGQRLADAGQRRQSLVAFRDAVKLDPSYAEARFAVASTYLRLAETGELSPAEAFPIARAEAERALALEEVADTRLVLGQARFLFDWDWVGARREFERAVALAPASTATLCAYARLLSAAGEHRAALETIARAEAKSPSCDLIVHESGWIHYRARRYADAIRKFERSAELGPPRSEDDASWRKNNRFRILLVHLQMRATAAAAQDAHEIARLHGTPPDRLAAFRALPAEEAVRTLLRTSLKVLSGLAEREYVSPVRFAELHAALGEDEEALRWLSRAAQERAPALAYSLDDPVFDRLGSRPVFQQIAARLGHPIGVRAGPRVTLVAAVRG